MPVENIMYSEKYDDDSFEYRHVTLPPDLAKLVPRNHLMTETEWRNLGINLGSFSTSLYHFNMINFRSTAKSWMDSLHVSYT